MAPYQRPGPDEPSFSDQRILNSRPNLALIDISMCAPAACLADDLKLAMRRGQFCRQSARISLRQPFHSRRTILSLLGKSTLICQNFRIKLPPYAHPKRGSRTAPWNQFRIVCQTELVSADQSDEIFPLMPCPASHSMHSV